MTRPRGFSLLELLLVVLILALLAALAAPALWRGLDGARERALRDQVAHWLRAQPRAALQAGRAHQPDATAHDLLPPGVQLQFAPLPHYDYRGLCSGGVARLLRDDGQVIARWRILAPSGAVQLLQETAP